MTVLPQLMEGIMKAAVSNPDMVAVQIMSMKLVDQISKIVAVNILRMDVAQIIRRQLEVEIMKDVVVNMLHMVAVQIN